MDLDLKALELSKKWPKLARLQDEVLALEQRLQAAEVQVRTLQNQLGSARDKDLTAAAVAVRAGKEVPHGSHEDSAKRQLQAAERDRDVLQRAVESTRQDLSGVLQKHRAELYQDVVARRAAIGATVSEAAREALTSYSRYEDLRYLLRDLEPPPDAVDYNGPAARSTTTVIGVATTQRGPERGHVEGILQHLISLAAPAASGDAPGDSNAA